MFSFVLFGIFHTYLCAEDGCVFFTTGATIGAKTAYPSRVHGFTPVFSGFRVSHSPLPFSLLPESLSLNLLKYHY